MRQGHRFLYLDHKASYDGISHSVLKSLQFLPKGG